ncbi:hypothetical protein SELMODRAFT_440190 [Selaginella moellendorffii]|uniref:C2 domain-containing protein n=1 Tax=Selaginella moellendorffii TaxID=88036 RepID=D8R946_SELML|nr:uncharacterized protein LOC9633327 [Selaginella moellendorffii]EFJ31352.1 hypothetical protein SELMODRAFT_440190 [Selaginella moellendorffii]|eukprot:XP_002968005.1 uncharacterized protein LOC9633327 [Selaginella moellendorffii]
MGESQPVPRIRRRNKQPQMRLLEFYVISAQELRRVRKDMNCFVVAYVSADKKVKTEIDFEGITEPTWQEKLSLEVEEAAFKEDSNSQLTFDIFCPGFLRDKLVGTVRISLVDAVKPSNQPYPISSYLVFTPDGDSQGMLNVCVAPGGVFPKRLDFLSFKRVKSIHGTQLEAVPSFKKFEAEETEEESGERVSFPGGIVANLPGGTLG